MINYNSTGTVRLFWNRLNKNMYGLHINEIEPPDREPINNAVLAGSNSFGIDCNYIKVYTFDVTKLEERNVVNKIIRVLENPNNFYSFVQVDQYEDYTGVFISEESPDPKYATFNVETNEWDLPENYVALKTTDDLNTRKEEILKEIEKIELKSIRSLEEILLSTMINNNKPNSNDVQYFINYMNTKTELRNELTQIESELFELNK
jgi:hypothetical protein